MFRFVLSKLALAIPTLCIVAVAVFLIIRLVPGDPALLLLGDQADAGSLADMRAKLGLNESVVAQFLSWAIRGLHGDLGNSISTGQAVLPLVWERFCTSAQIVVVAVFLSALVAVPAGTIAAWKQDRLPDLILIGGATLLVSIPAFWMGLLILILFGLKLHWLPVVGFVSIADNWKGGLIYLFMPVLTLFLHEIGVLIRMSRSSSLEVLQMDYVTHARAKGLSEWRVLRHHVLRNAFGPTWTMIGLVLGNLLGGIAVVETVFSIPGLGRLLVDAINARDYPVIQGALIFIAVIYVVVNVVIDLFYPVFDPRVVSE